MKKTILALMATAAIVACSKSDDKEDDHTSGKFPKKITQITGTTRVERTFELQDATRPKKETITTYQGSSTNGRVETHEYNYDSNNSCCLSTHNDCLSQVFGILVTFRTMLMES